jgi:hypothetical protein
MQEPDPLDTLEGALLFLRRIRDEAQTRGVIAVTPKEFCRAVALGAITYEADNVGVSMEGSYVGEMSPRLGGTRAAILIAGA